MTSRLEDMPRTFDCSLADAVGAALRVSRSKAKKFIRRGDVRVNDVVTRDPDARVQRTDRIACGGDGSFERR